MPLKDAERLISDMRKNSELRYGAYDCSGGAALKDYFQSRGYVFDDYEWEDAANSMRLKAVDAEAAAEIMDIREWYKFMRGL